MRSLSRSRALYSMCVALGWLAAPHAARAEEAPYFELAWEAPAECPDGASVTRQAHALVRQGGPARRGLLAQGQVTRADDGRWLLRLTLTEDGKVEERELAGDSCQALVDSVAVILSLQLNASEGKPQPQPAAPVPPPAPPPAPPPKAATPPTAAPETGFLQLGVAGAADSVALPRFALGGRLELGLAFDRFYLGAGGGLWLGQEASLQEGHAGRGQFAWRAASLWGCHASFGRRVRVGPCLAAEVGELSARSLGVRAPAEVSELWLAALGGVSFWAPLGSGLVFTSSLTAVVPLRRPRFVVEGIGDIHQPRALGARSALGLAWRF